MFNGNRYTKEHIFGWGTRFYKVVIKIGTSNILCPDKSEFVTDESEIEIQK